LPVRLFIAIELEDRVKEALLGLQQSLGRFDRVVRWVTRDQMHLTLVFLGEVRDDRVPAVCEAVKRAADRSEPFELTFTGSGCFPPGGRVRVVWAGIEEPTGALLRCQAACAEELEAGGFPRESRPYSAHLTLGRVRDDTTRGELRDHVGRIELAPLPQSVDAVHVVQSRLAPSGAQYSKAASYHLSP
jgi:2'-5' RNA ligase